MEEEKMKGNKLKYAILIGIVLFFIFGLIVYFQTSGETKSEEYESSYTVEDLAIGDEIGIKPVNGTAQEVAEVLFPDMNLVWIITAAIMGYWFLKMVGIIRGGRRIF